MDQVYRLVSGSFNTLLSFHQFHIGTLILGNVEDTVEADKNDSKPRSESLRPFDSATRLGDFSP